jgi:hypothetical protein
MYLRRFEMKKSRFTDCQIQGIPKQIVPGRIMPRWGRESS